LNRSASQYVVRGALTIYLKENVDFHRPFCGGVSKDSDIVYQLKSGD